VYAILGRGFAYLGIPPLYVGELCLAVGLLSVNSFTPFWTMARKATAGCLLCFMLWGAFRTYPFIETFGLLALRDAAAWGYGSFALILMAIVLKRPYCLTLIRRYYPAFAKAYLLILPAVWIATTLMAESIPKVPGTQVPLINLRAEEALVHLAAITALALSRCARWSAIWLGLLAIDVLLFFPFNRGGMLAYIVASGLAAAVNVSWRKLWPLLACGVTLLLLVTWMGVPIEGIRRPLSVDQLKQNIMSIVDPSFDTSELEATRRWRLAWWTKIVDYTVFGEYFWTGKGFGVNLAYSDGQGTIDSSLRSPHNGHLTILARAGVPGLAMWLLLQAGYFCTVGRAYIKARLAGETVWRTAFLVLLVYWCAYCISMAFTVALEGPMTGIWYWSVFGIGLGASYVYKRQPYLFAPSVPRKV
jgi:hypothetical protein